MWPSNVVTLPEKNGGRDRRYSNSNMVAERSLRDLVFENESREEFQTCDNTVWNSSLDSKPSMLRVGFPNPIHLEVCVCGGGGTICPGSRQAGGYHT